MFYQSFVKEYTVVEKIILEKQVEIFTLDGMHILIQKEIRTSKTFVLLLRS